MRWLPQSSDKLETMISHVVKTWLGVILGSALLIFGVIGSWSMIISFTEKPTSASGSHIDGVFVLIAYVAFGGIGFLLVQKNWKILKTPYRDPEL